MWKHSLIVASLFAIFQAQQLQGADKAWQESNIEQLLKKIHCTKDLYPMHKDVLRASEAFRTAIYSPQIRNFDPSLQRVTLGFAQFVQQALLFEDLKDSICSLGLFIDFYQKSIIMPAKATQQPTAVQHICKAGYHFTQQTRTAITTLIVKTPSNKGPQLNQLYRDFLNKIDEEIKRLGASHEVTG